MDQSSEHKAGPATPRPQHTPGPWQARVEDLCVDDAQGHPILETAGVLVTIATDEANLRLAAAAPDLLAVCEAFLSPDGWEGSVLGAQMRAAVAKAKGLEQ